MKNHFMLGYAGNKRNECEHIYEALKGHFNNFKIIVEPFCGSCAFSYYMSKKHPKKYKYVINDNNEMLINLINLAKDEIKYNEFIDRLKLMFDDCMVSKEEYNKLTPRAKTELEAYVFIHKVYNIRPGLYPISKQFKKECFDAMRTCPFLDFIRNEDVTVSCRCGVSVYDEYRGNEDALIFLDPPYLDSCNDYYFDSKVNIYEFLFENNIDNEDSYIMLCLEKMWIIQLLFKGKRLIEYSKLYQPKKRMTTHIIIVNFE